VPSEDFTPPEATEGNIHEYYGHELTLEEWAF
jgi:hypothetical protein